MSAVEGGRDPLAALRDPATIRARCAAVTQAVEQGLSGYFQLDRSRLDEAADRVAALTRERFPDLRIPPHSRWRHFAAGGVDRKSELDALMAGRTPAEVARARIDLTVVSVLLDAGAGAAWRYHEGPGGVDAMALPVHRQSGSDLLAMLEQASGGATSPAPAQPPAPAAPPIDAAATAVYTRSEGLAVASLRAFVAGVFSDSTTDPLRVDARALQRMRPSRSGRRTRWSAWRDVPRCSRTWAACSRSRHGPRAARRARAGFSTP